MGSHEGDEEHEGNEGYESHEGDEGYEEGQASVDNCQRLSCQVGCLQGHQAEDCGCLTKAALTTNSTGKIVSKKASANGKKAYTHIKGWNKAVASARKALALTGFVAVNGKTAQGKALYAKAKAIYNQ